jgi:hypothetical protein
VFAFEDKSDYAYARSRAAVAPRGFTETSYAIIKKMDSLVKREMTSLSCRCVLPWRLSGFAQGMLSQFLFSCTSNTISPSFILSRFLSWTLYSGLLLTQMGSFTSRFR